MTEPTGDPPGTVAAGTFRVDRATGSWWWSDAVYAIHGFAPHEVVPTTGLFVAHLHPDDREDVRAALDRTLADGVPMRSAHRLVDARGREHFVTVVLEAPAPPDGTAAVLRGHLVDATARVDAQARAEATASIVASARNRALIDQAVGAIAFSEQVDAETAFAMLRVASNDANVPLRHLGRLIAEALPGLGGDPERLNRFLRDLTAAAHQHAPRDR